MTNNIVLLKNKKRMVTYRCILNCKRKMYFVNRKGGLQTYYFIYNGVFAKEKIRCILCIKKTQQ